MQNGTEDKKNKEMEGEERAIQDLEAKAERKAIESGNETQKVIIEYNKAMRRYMENKVEGISEQISGIKETLDKRVPENLPEMANEFQKQQIIAEHHKNTIQKWKNIAGLVITGAALASIVWAVFEFAVQNVN